MKKIRISFYENIDGGYMFRWRLLPMIKIGDGDDARKIYPPFNVFLHHFMASDRGRDLHDHPWPSVSFLLKGKLYERYESDGGLLVRRVPLFVPIRRKATHKHRLILHSYDAWTIFIVGFKQRTWGFWPDGKFVQWREYLGIGNSETID